MKKFANVPQNFHVIKKMLKITSYCKQANYFTRRLCVNSVLWSDEKKPKRKVSETVELVTLVDQDGKILGLKPKPESEKLARKLNLTLEKTDDPKYGKMYPAYKMVSTSDLLKHVTKSSTAKILKKLPINSRISDNDLKIKIQTIQKWLAKRCEVHVAVSANNEPVSLMKSVFEKIKEEFKEGSRIIDIRQKEGALKFIMLPPKDVSAINDNQRTIKKSEVMKDNNK